MYLVKHLDTSDRIRLGMGWLGTLLAVVLPSLNQLLTVVQIVGAIGGAILAWITVVTAWRKMPRRRKKED